MSVGASNGRFRTPCARSIDVLQHPGPGANHRLDRGCSFGVDRRRAFGPNGTVSKSGERPRIERMFIVEASTGGTIDHAQQNANHESPRTTKRHDRANDGIRLDEIERLLI